MVTRQELEKKLAKYKEEIKKLAGEKDSERAVLRTFRKRLRRTKRKLVSVLLNEERLAAAKGKSKAEAKAPAEKKAPESGESAAGKSEAQ